LRNAICDLIFFSGCDSTPKGSSSAIETGSFREHHDRLLERIMSPLNFHKESDLWTLKRTLLDCKVGHSHLGFNVVSGI
jgi:hypothetical protein